LQHHHWQTRGQHNKGRRLLKVSKVKLHNELPNHNVSHHKIATPRHATPCLASPDHGA
jgi:hypothetical protein